MKLRITTLSYLLTGTGEGTMLIDADSVFHASGFPYIPARRIKGLLRESAEEVLQITFGEEYHSYNWLIDQLFGISGDVTQSSNLLIPNLHLEKWDEILSEWEALRNSSDHKTALSPSFIQEFYTTEIAQTAIENNTAKEHSLRKYRVVNLGLTFENELKFRKEPTKAQKALLYLAVLNVQNMGTRRNRGLGQVNCTLSISDINPEKALKILTGASNTEQIGIEKQDSVDETTNFPVNNDRIDSQLEINIELTSPVVLTTQGSNSNTVETEKYIPGSTIRGIIASNIIERLKLGTKAHENPFFEAAVLSDKIIYNNANLVLQNNRTVTALPLMLHKEKGKEKKPNAVNILTESVENLTGKNLKPVGGIAAIDSKNNYSTAEIEITEMFHNSRENRVAGRSTGDGIFYYESLSEGQNFRGYLSGPKEILSKLKEILGDEFEASAGRSKSVQYSDIEVKLGAITPLPDFGFPETEDNQFLLVCESPLIVSNEFGFAEPSGLNLELYFKKKGLEITVQKAATAYKTVEHYVGIWKSKTENYHAFKEGSAFLLKIDGFEEKEELITDLVNTGIGELTELGYGKVRLMPALEDEDIQIKKLQISEDPDYLVPLNHLKRIYSAYKKKAKRITTERDALKYAIDFKGNVNNHLISRLENLFKLAKDKNELTGWIDTDLDGKPAGKSLDDLGWTDKITESGRDWEYLKLYWLTFLKVLRKRNKTSMGGN